MPMTRLPIPALVCIVMLAAASGAEAAEPERATALRKLVACRSIADITARVACFDREVAAIDAAEARKDLVVFDRAQVRKTQRSLFGLSLPDLNIFGDDSKDAQKEIVSTIKRAWVNSNQKWAFELPDGARWAQTDSRVIHLDPRPGDSIRIRRAALGSYLANIGRQTAVRVQRIR